MNITVLTPVIIAVDSSLADRSKYRQTSIIIPFPIRLTVANALRSLRKMGV
ncbi:hypothetical protein J2Z28_004598 [Paenibacillus xylanexedens]|uniref:Uncharacterized protein n=1 Tax=Paenibacillus xylanexedens TaxID=528191 RepID=A0ABS4RYG5_PAEXY|nr:hypothetical protein [Paenibacillus xylanexedens]